MSISRRNYAAPRFISGSSSPPEHPPSSGATTTESGRQREVRVVRGSSSTGVSSGTSVLREVVRAAVTGQREKKGGERSREIFPHRLEKPTPHQTGYRGGRRRWRRRGRDARRAAGGDEKRGRGESYPGWSRWWLGAAASKIHRNHTARLHRRSRHLPPPNRNETARVKHPILLPPSRSCPATRRSNGQVKNHHRRDRDRDRLWHPVRNIRGDISAIHAAEKFRIAVLICARTKMYHEWIVIVVWIVIS